MAGPAIPAHTAVGIIARGRSCDAFGITRKCMPSMHLWGGQSCVRCLNIIGAVEYVALIIIRRSHMHMHLPSTNRMASK